MNDPSNDPVSSRTPVLDDRAVAQLVVDTEPYLSCDDCFERVDTYVERRVAGLLPDDPEMVTHLAGCGVCAEEAAALEELVRAGLGG